MFVPLLVLILFLPLHSIQLRNWEMKAEHDRKGRHLQVTKVPKFPSIHYTRQFRSQWHPVLSSMTTSNGESFNWKLSRMKAAHMPHSSLLCMSHKTTMLSSLYYAAKSSVKEIFSEKCSPEAVWGNISHCIPGKPRPSFTAITSKLPMW